MSSSAAISAVMLGLLFIDQTSNNRDTLEMEFVFWVLLIMNVAFLLRWIVTIAKIYIFKIRSKVEKDK